MKWNWLRFSEAGLFAAALLALVGGCDDPFTPPEDPRSPIPAQPLARPAEKAYVSQEEMLKLSNYLQATFAEAQARAEKVRKLKDAGDPAWNGGWFDWKAFSDRHDRLISVKRDLFNPAPYQEVPGHPLPCFDLALNYLNAVINAYGLNLGQDRPLDTQLISDFQAKVAQCQELLGQWEPAQEFSGTPPPEIK
jgi:hypothetical protein